MGVTNRLVFDPADANSIAASSSIGAFVRAGTDGDLIGSETLNSLEWLRVTGPIIDSDGNEVAVTGNALDVNVASGSITVTESDVYAEDTAHTTGDDGGFVLSVRVDDLTAVPATALAGTELDYQAFITGPNGELFIGANQLDIDDLDATNDNVAISDGTDTLAINTDGSINTTASSFATAKNTATAVSVASIAVVTAALADRREIWFANEGNKSLYWGMATGLTAANGFPMHPGQQHQALAGDGLTLNVIGGTGASSEDMRVMEFA